MPKATVDDVLGHGFKAEQFGRPDNFAAENGLLWQLLTLVGLTVETAIGAATYAAATSSATGADALNYHVLRSAEKYLACADLWRRREVFSDSELSVARSQGAGQTIASRYLENAERFEQRANDLLSDRFGVRLATPSGLAAGYIETGIYGLSA